MLRGLTTTSFFADDLDAAAAWYTRLFGIEPDFTNPAGYIEFRIMANVHYHAILDRMTNPEA